MKKMSKMFTLLIAVVMVLGMSTAVFAQTVPDGSTQQDGKGQITVSNAAKGEKYKVIKLFDASVTGTEGGSVRYTGDIPDALSAYFEKDEAGNIHATAAAGSGDSMSADLKAALKEWAGSAADGVESDGSTLYFNNLDYGYYVVCTTQGEALVSVNTTNPIVSVIDKNTTIPVTGLGKKVDQVDEIVSIGDTVNYTITFGTANYDGENQITKYEISDTLPDFLEDVVVDSIIVDDDGNAETTNDQHDVTAQFSNKKITLTWAENGQNLYKNGAKITIKYHATVGDAIEAGNVDTNANTVTVDPYAGDKKVDVDNNTTTETIKTYAAAVQKVDENGADLAGATFQVPGLVVTGSAGDYTVVSYDPTSESAGTTMSCDPTGFLVIRGLSNEATITIYEVDAPEGYNKLTSGVTLPVVATSSKTTTTVSTETTTTYYDADGNVVSEAVEGGTTVTVEAGTITTNEDLVSGALSVENEKGATLPSTGGMGTTIFYVLGTILVIGAAIVLVSRRRMNNK